MACFCISDYTVYGIDGVVWTWFRFDIVFLVYTDLALFVGPHGLHVTVFAC